eukprot:6187798-Pleurochrysis_carterae.AAC.2
MATASRIIEWMAPGDGTLPKVGDKLLVHYTGCLAHSGRCFDSSRARGHAFTFTVRKEGYPRLSFTDLQDTPFILSVPSVLRRLTGGPAVAAVFYRVLCRSGDGESHQRMGRPNADSAQGRTRQVAHPSRRGVRIQGFAGALALSSILSS